MEVTLAVLADGANVSREGKLNIFGAFDRIGAESFPCQHPMMSLVLRFDADAEDFEKPLSLSIVLYDEDMHQHGRVDGEITARATVDGTHSIADEIIPIPNMPFPKAGRYLWRIMLEGVVKAETPLTLIQL